MISAVLLSWRRPENLRQIIASLWSWDRVSEVIVWNNDPEMHIQAPDRRVTVINSSRNFYCFARYAMVPLLANDTVLFHDDDLCLRPEQLEQIYVEYAKDAGRVYGPFGKRIVDGLLYEQTPAGPRARQNHYGEVDIILGRCSLFNRSLYQRALKHIPLPIKYEDDVAFSLAATKASGRRHIAIKVGPFVDICGSDEHSSWKTRGFAQAREIIVQRLK